MTQSTCTYTLATPYTKSEKLREMLSDILSYEIKSVNETKNAGVYEIVFLVPPEEIDGPANELSQLASVSMVTEV